MAKQLDKRTRLGVQTRFKVMREQPINAGFSSIGCHSCIIADDGRLHTWGMKTDGQLGREENEVRVPLQGVVACSIGWRHTLVLCDDGRTYGCGSNGYGQLGETSSSFHNSVQEISGLSDIVAISCGGNHSLALDKDGFVWSFGSGTQGQLGTGTTPSGSPPKKVKQLKDVVQISAGSYHNLALTADNKIYSWGHGENGRLGNSLDSSDDVPLPTEITSLSDIDIKCIASGVAHSMVVTKSGTVYGWGYGEYGQLGIGHSPINHSIPTKIASISKVAGVACGWRHTLAFTESGLLYAWGWNDCGQLGDGTLVDRASPVLISGLDVVSAFCGGKHSMVLTRKGQLYAWGKNEDGQLWSDWKDPINKPKKLDIYKLNMSTVHWSTHSHPYYCLRWKLNQCMEKLLLLWLAKNDRGSIVYALNDIAFLITVTLLSIPVEPPVAPPKKHFGFGMISI
eukprot:TRINITY_DN7311_c0_g1_i2.p1 TRINITY_DN7311_c0_g1~~TRINITY_DN7311_c0_g1_i2.p1  ORF type:complete len:453 (-),score=54.40 TRINITY_DN7311_c0_g1_i2:125-1483(-)